MKNITTNINNLASIYPDVFTYLTDTTNDLLSCFAPVEIPARTLLYSQNDYCDKFMWLTEGAIRVYKNSPEGREITLYRIEPGDLCILSLQSILCDKGFPAHAITESDIKGFILPNNDFHHLVDNSSEFNRYLLKNISQRIGTIMDLVSEVTFQRLDLRLACYLGQIFERSHCETVHITHAKIANELGSTREVISRLLKEFEQQKCIKLSRGKIQLMSNEAFNWAKRKSY